MGTPDFALPSLEVLVSSPHRVVGVVTQPDRPRGRGKKVQPPPVKVRALSLGLPVFQPQRVKEEGFVDLVRGLAPDAVVVVAYGQILPPSILRLPPYGCINLHASLLPRYRGAAPIQRAIMNGEKETGVTTMLMDEGLDTGGILLQRRVPIYEEDTAGKLHDRLAREGAELLLETLDLLARGDLAPRPQDHRLATYAPPLTPEDELIDWRRPARDLYNQVRALNPWPVARTWLEGKVLKVWRAAASPLPPPAEAQPGEVVLSRKELVVATGVGCLALLEIQLEGGKRLPAEDFLRGRPIPEGTVLGKRVEGCFGHETV